MMIMMTTVMVMIIMSVSKAHERRLRSANSDDN